MNKFGIDYELCGVVNGCAVDAHGKGEADFKNGVYELEITCEKVPMMWDPAYVILMTCDRFMGVCGSQIGGAKNIFSLSGGNHFMGDRQGVVYDSNHRNIAHFRSASTGFTKDGVIYSRSQIKESRFDFHPEERLKSIDGPFRGTMQPFREDMMIVNTAYSFSTNLDSSFYGFTRYPYVMPDVNKVALKELSPQLLDNDEVSFSRKRIGNSGEVVKFRVHSSILELLAKK